MVERGHGWQRWSRGREDRRSSATDSQRHGRGAEDATGGTEAVRRAGASPTPTGSTRATQSAHRSRRRHRGGQRHPPPPGTLSRPPQWRRGGTRCRRWCGATLSPSRAHSPARRAAGHDRRHRVRSVHQSHTLPTEGAQMAHRARSGGDENSYPPTAPRRATAAQDDPQMVRGTPIEIWRHGTAGEPETRTAQGLTGCAEKSRSDLKKLLT